METFCHEARNRRALRVAGLTVGLWALFALLPGCSILFSPPPGCAPLEEMCPNLECAVGFVVNDDGCALCECAEPEPEPTACWDDSDCGGSKQCDRVNFCEQSPDCDDGEACEPVCYGRCVEPPEACFSDGDCDADERCAFTFGDGGGDRAAPEPAPPCDPSSSDCFQEPPADPPTGEGVCVPTDCARPDIAVVCPAGTRHVIDVSEDPCGIDRCEPTGGDCGGLSPDECLGRDDCELVSDGGRAPCFCEVGSDCACEEPVEDPPAGEVCVSRQPTGECFSDFDCGPGQRCEETTVCGGVCEVVEGGEVVCTDDCQVVGMCTGDISPEECELDSDCGPGRLCEEVEVCDGNCGAPAPDDGDAAPCFQECRMQGQCVEDPSHQSCWSDADCGEQQHCELLPDCGVPPPDCPSCLIACEGTCVDDDAPPPVESCQVDDDCSADLVCDSVNYCESPPGCDEEGVDCPPVCYGRCVEPTIDDADHCLEQSDCQEGYRCADEVDACYCAPGSSCDVCYWQCVADDAP